MAEISGVSPGDAAAFQEQYLRLLEELLLVTDQNSQQDSKRSGVRIFDGERLVYGYDGKESKNEIFGVEGNLLNPDFVQQLVELRSTPVGNAVEGATNKRVELDGRVLLQSDGKGKVVINELIERIRNDLETSQLPEMESIEAQELPNWHSDADGSAFRPRNRDEAVKTLAESFAGLREPAPPQQKPQILSMTQEQMSKTIEEVKQALRQEDYKGSIEFSTTKSETSKSPDFKAQEQQENLERGRERVVRSLEPQENLERGSERVLRSLEQLPDSPTKQLASSYTQEIQALLQVAQAQQHQINELQNSVRELTTQLRQQRLAEPQNKSWWDNAKTILASTWNQWDRWWRSNQAAAAIHKLYLQNFTGDNKAIQLSDYRVEREGKNYTLRDNSGQVLMQFRSTPLGVRIDAASIQLKPKHYQDIDHLSSQQARGEQPDGPFSRLGAQEAAFEVDYYIRARNIAARLVDYAASKGQDVTLDGRFSYKWKAKPDGEVQIYAKDGRGLVLAQAGDKMLCRMSDRDLGYFEKALLKLPQGKVVRTITASPNSRKRDDMER